VVTKLTAEALVDMSLVSDPRISPNGAMIAVAVSPASKRDEHQVSAIWLVSANGSEPERQITSGTARDHHPRWADDGGAIAFLSDRKERGVNQVFLLRLNGGEAQPLTTERGGVSSFAWIPGDRKRIAYLAVDARDEAEEKRRQDERDDANVYGEFWPYARVVVLDLESGESRSMDTGERHVASLSPSPDGVRLALTLWPTPEIDHVMASSQLATLNLETGNLRLIDEPGFNADGITWSSDGRSLYFYGRGGDTAVSSYQLWTVDLDLDTGHICLTNGLSACVYDLTRARESDAILVLVAEGTGSAIYQLTPKDNQFTKLMHFRGDLRGLSASDDGETIATVGGTADRPGDVYTGSPVRDLERKTAFNTWLDDVRLGEQEIVTWERAGFTLDGILIWPPDRGRSDAPMPVIVSIHGGPYGRWSNTFITTFGRWLAAQGYLVFLPNPRGGMGHGQAFAEAVLNTVGNDDYLDIMAGVDMLIEEGIADPERLGCGGWSQGGFMTAWIVGQTDRFKAGVMGAGISDWGMMIATSDIPTYENLMGGGNPHESAGPHSFDRQSPISYVHNASTPTLIVHGENDERVPVSQAIFFHRGLRAYGVPVELVTYPREPHGIQERNHQLDLLTRVSDWYRRWIPLE
jgi:dipeptidyl aminopeptidase/acylaminoacyl peptidase